MTKIKPLPIDKPVRVGVVGLGGVAQLKHLPILASMDSVELVGFAEEESYKLSMMSEKYGVPGFVDTINLFQRIKPDVVLICTPPISHLPIALTALRSGAHVIVEKPAARDLAETERMASAAKDTNKHIFVAMNQRFRQDVTVLKNFTDADELGDIWRVRSGWEKRISSWQRSPWLAQKAISGGGVLLDLGLQLIDLVLWILDYPEVERLSAFKNNDALKKEVEDTLSAIIKLNNGTTVNLDCSWALMGEKSNAYTILEGDKATASLNPLVLHKLLMDELVTVKPVKTANSRNLYTASFQAQMHHFISAMKGEVAPISTIDEAVKVMKIVDLIYKSAEDNKEIIL
jgi:predicted dehydrogenase